MGVLDRFAQGLWQHGRQHFGLWAWGSACIFVCVGILIPVVVLVSVWFDLTSSEILVLFALISSLVWVGAIPGFLGNVDVRMVSAWGRGARDRPEDTWRSALSLPVTVSRRGVGVVTVLHLCVTLPVLKRLADLGQPATAAAGVGLAGVMLASGIVVSIGFQFLLRPVLREIEPHLESASADGVAAWGLGTRLVLGVFSACFIGAIGGAAAAQQAATTDARFVAVVLAALPLAAYLTVLLWFGMLRPSLEPIDQLTRATQRVRRGDYDQRVPVTTADELGDLVSGFNEMQRGLREREALHAAFGSYVDPALAQRLLDSGSSVFEGESLELTVLFADVRDFTSYSEGVDPEEAVERLNRLFEVMVPLLHVHGGHANRYLGDGLLAVFGAPQPLVHHADAALAAAVEIQQQLRAKFGSELRLGIGINTGPVIAGTVGGGGRHEFTVIGDTVNVAARVEQLTKDTGDGILITEPTRKALSTPRPRSTKRGAFDLKGKSAAVTVHAVNPFARSTR